jgi:hypothetical protein
MILPAEPLCYCNSAERFLTSANQWERSTTSARKWEGGCSRKSKRPITPEEEQNGVKAIEELLEKPERINDPGQWREVKHKLSDINAIVFFAMPANADEWEEIQTFAVMYEEILREYLELSNGIPSRDMTRRVMGEVGSGGISAVSAGVE